jgi:transcriptional regulator with XRE-family HTH domain
MHKKVTGLKVWLMSNGMSQSELADNTGLHRNTVARLVNTGDGSKSVKMLIQLYLKLDKDEFDRLLE